MKPHVPVALVLAWSSACGPPPLPGEEPAEAAAALSASNDSYVSSRYPEQVLEGRPYLKVGGDASNIHRTFLMFTVSGIPAGSREVRATLSVYSLSSSPRETYAHCGTSNQWSASTLDWDEQPPFEGSPVATVDSLATDHWARFDVSRCIDGSGTFTLVLTRIGPDVSFSNSRSAGQQPSLEVTHVAPVALGVFTPRSPRDPSAITAYAALVGRSPALIQWYQSWGTGCIGSNAFNTREFDTIVNASATPVMTWQPMDCPQTANDASFKLSRIIRGDHDAYIRAWAEAAKAWGKPFFLRFAHEMNGDWYAWGTAPGNANGNTAAEYVKAWKHVRGIFRSVGATNAKWVWCPFASSHPDFCSAKSYADLYPGDDEVDWIGLDGYNWGGANWRSLKGVFETAYGDIAPFTRRPFMINETASNELGGSKAEWMKTAFQEDLARDFPRIRAALWFNGHGSQGKPWPVDSSPAALKAWQEIVASPYFHAGPPL